MHMNERPKWDASANGVPNLFIDFKLTILSVK